MSDRPRAKALLLLLATLAFVTSPLWTGGFGGFDAGQFPVPQDRPPVQPAGYAFSIWGLIYLWLLAHAVFGALRRPHAPAWDGPRWPLALSLAPGAAWIAVAGASPVWASVLIFWMLGAALAALLATPATEDRWLLLPPVGLYAGWLTAASFVSVGLLLGGYGVVPETLAAWIAVAGLLATAVWVQSRVPSAPEYSAAVAWALVAVSVQNGSGNLPLTMVAALSAAALLGLALTLLRRRDLPAGG